MQYRTLFSGFVIGASALEVPSNVRSFYNKVKDQEDCTNKLATGFYNDASDDGKMSYCGDHLDDYGIVFLKGPGKLANLDPDCDGAQGGPQDDGRCDGSTDTQSQTSIRDIIRDYGVGISDLNAHEHSYIVFGNSGSSEEWKTFDPATVGVEEASIMAVVCGDKMFYAIWGDVNGDDGPRPSVGEVSISLGTACYGKDIRAGDGPGSSHDDPDVLYLAFTGAGAVPGADGANWTAGNFEDFHASLVDQGNKLIERIGGSDGGGDPPCSWKGHCAGASCSSAQDCSDSLTCSEGRCAAT